MRSQEHRGLGNSSRRLFSYGLNTDPPQRDSEARRQPRGQERPAPTPLLTRDPEPGPLRRPGAAHRARGEDGRRRGSAPGRGPLGAAHTCAAAGGGRARGPGGRGRGPRSRAARAAPPPRAAVTRSWWLADARSPERPARTRGQRAGPAALASPCGSANPCGPGLRPLRPRRPSAARAPLCPGALPPQVAPGAAPPPPPPRPPGGSRLRLQPAALGPDCASAKPPARPGGRRRTTQARRRAARSAQAPRRKRSDVITGRLCARGKMAEQVTKSVLFVCLGNICRSPIAEAVFRKLVTDQSISDHWVVDSGAVSDWNVGRSPDPRAVSCLRNHGINTAHKARQVTKEDFATFDYILCMDESNLRDLNRKSNQVKNCRAKIELLGSYDPQKQLIIEDPYYGNEADFETVYQQCVRCCRAFLEKVR
ncbi:hypothetical protein AB1E18_007078 [Capra hircus]